MHENEILRLWSGGKKTYALRSCKTPCPGCGKAGKSRPSDKVCLDCFTDLLEMKVVREKLQAESSGQAEALTLPWAPHSLPYVPNDNHDHDPKNPNVQCAFYGLMEHFGKPVSGADVSSEPMIESEKNQGYSSAAQPRLYPPGTQKLARDLFTAIIRLSSNAYATGFEEGNDLLGKLAKGDATIKDYEEDLKRGVNRRKK